MLGRSGIYVLCSADRLLTLRITVKRFYECMLYLLDGFAHHKLTKFVDAGNLRSVKHWLSEDIVGALADRNRAYDIWLGDPNRVKGDRL
jgi:hypothetical protein